MYALSRSARPFEISQQHCTVPDPQYLVSLSPNKADFSTSCVKHGATRSSLSRHAVRLDRMLAVASRTKRSVYSLQLEQCQKSLPWNKHGKWQTRESYYVPYTVLITKMSNELSLTQMTQTLSKYVCTTVQRCGEICRNCGYALRTTQDRYLQIHDIAAGSRNQPSTAVHQ